MSGLSFSITFLVPAVEAPAILTAIEANNLSILDSYANPQKQFLSASSRNNCLEYELRALVKEFGRDELTYLGIWEEVINRGKPHVVKLQGDVLSSAVVRLRNLISSLREYPERYISFLNREVTRYTVEDVANVLAMMPLSSFDESQKRFNSYSQVDDVGDIWTLQAFLYAQLSLLEIAQTEDISAVYAVWLY